MDAVMPDRHGNFKGISVPALPWLEEQEALDELERDKDAEARKDEGFLGRVLRDEWPFDDNPPDPL